MNPHSKSLSKTKLTKKQRKLRAGPNAATIHSLNKGPRQPGGYRGEPPVYQIIYGRYLKVQRGIPYAKAANYSVV